MNGLVIIRFRHKLSIFLLLAFLFVSQCNISPYQIETLETDKVGMEGTITPSVTLTLMPTTTNTLKPSDTATISPTTQTRTPTVTFTPSPTPFGGLIGLIAFQKKQFGDIWISSIDGQNLRNLTETFKGYITRFYWSQDGEWILFTKVAKLTNNGGVSSESQSELWAVRPDGTEAHYIWNFPKYTQNISLSTDGKKFISNCDSKRICVVSLENFEITRFDYSGDFMGHGHSAPLYSPGNNSFAWISNFILFVVTSLEEQPIEVPLPFVNFGYEFSWLSDTEILIQAIQNQNSSLLFTFSTIDNKLEENKRINYRFGLGPILSKSSRILIRSYISVDGGSRYGPPGLMDFDGNILVWFDNLAMAYIVLSPDSKSLIACNFNNGIFITINLENYSETPIEVMDWLKCSNFGNWSIQPLP